MSYNLTFRLGAHVLEDLIIGNKCMYVDKLIHNLC